MQVPLFSGIGSAKVKNLKLMPGNILGVLEFLTNLTKNSIIISLYKSRYMHQMKTIILKQLGIKEVKYCRSNFSQGLGFMFSRKNENRALVFELKKEKKIPLHMFFVFYSIDVLYLDENNNGEKRVVEIKENFKPFTFYFPKNKAKYIVELPVNTISKGQLNVNDIIML